VQPVSPTTLSMALQKTIIFIVSYFTKYEVVQFLKFETKLKQRKNIALKSNFYYHIILVLTQILIEYVITITKRRALTLHPTLPEKL